MWLGTCGLLRAGEFVQKPTTKYSLKLQHLTFHDAQQQHSGPSSFQTAKIQSICHSN